jgi:hypothetical protein
VDTIKNIKVISGIKGDIKLEIKFKKYISTGDTNDDYTFTIGSQTDLILAF